MFQSSRSACFVGWKLHSCVFHFANKSALCLWIPVRVFGVCVCGSDALRQRMRTTAKFMRVLLRSLPAFVAFCLGALLVGSSCYEFGAHTQNTQWLCLPSALQLAFQGMTLQWTQRVHLWRNVKLRSVVRYYLRLQCCMLHQKFGNCILQGMCVFFRRGNKIEENGSRKRCAARKSFLPLFRFAISVLSFPKVRVRHQTETFFFFSKETKMKKIVLKTENISCPNRIFAV